VGACDFHDREPFADFETGPSCLKRGVDIPRSPHLRFSREIVAAKKVHAYVLEDHLPEGDLRSRVVGGVGCVEVVPKWRLRTFDLWLPHAGNRHPSRAVRVFIEFAARTALKLFPKLPV
jgi:hypothetical protein